MENKKIVIELKDINKTFTLYNDQKEKLLSLIYPKKYGKKFRALKDVNFTAFEGETIGFIGLNGSGKSTLLNIIAGISPETSGDINIIGKTTLLTLNDGFKETLTGRENLTMKCLMLGFSNKRIKELEEEIIEFSELGEFIDQPMKTYSSGMKSKLGFSISVNVDTDILIVDEAISTGDETFANKCYNKIKELQNEGKTIIFVSHNASQIKKFCSKVLWLEYGRVKDFGETDDILKKFKEYIAVQNKMTPKEKAEYQRKLKFD